MSKRGWVYLSIALALSGLIAFTSFQTGEANSLAGGRIITFINNVFFGGNLSSAEQSSIVGCAGKLFGHFCLFMLDGLFYWLFVKENRVLSKRPFLFLIPVAVIMSCLGEFIQIFSAGRYPTMHDVFLDLSGFLLIPLLGELLNKERRLSQ